jgi:type I site-specific restriction-modification system R (restriction) subunit
VNRVFRDKPHGMIVDYIGIGDDLREATAKYTQGGGHGEPAPNLDESARPEFQRRLEDVRKLLPDGQDYAGWRKLSKVASEDLYSLVYGFLAEDDELREAFLRAEQSLTLSFLLVKHLDDCRRNADEVVFYQQARKQIAKSMPGTRPQRDLERAVRDLVDESVATSSRQPGSTRRTCRSSTIGSCRPSRTGRRRTSASSCSNNSCGRRSSTASRRTSSRRSHFSSCWRLRCKSTTTG